MGTKVQMEALLREAWRLHGQAFLETSRADIGDIDDPEILDALAEDDVARINLWESIREMLEVTPVKEFVTLSERVGALEEVIAKVGDLDAMKSDLSRLVVRVSSLAKREDQQIRDVVIVVLRELLGGMDL